MVNPSTGKAAPTAAKSSSAEKAARVALKKQKRNKGIRSQVKTDIIRAEKLIYAGKLDEAAAAINTAVSALDKAAGKKVLPANNAARRKSRLLKKLGKAKAQPPTPPKAEKSA